MPNFYVNWSISPLILPSSFAPIYITPKPEEDQEDQEKTPATPGIAPEKGLQEESGSLNEEGTE
jgi:hypothetical protein